MNESDLIRYLDLLSTQQRVIEGRIDAVTAVLHHLIQQHPNQGVLEAQAKRWLEQPPQQAELPQLAPAQRQARVQGALVHLDRLFDRVE